MNEKFVHGHKLIREIEQEIIKLSESTDFQIHTPSENTTLNPNLYNEKIKTLDEFYENIAKILNNLATLINDMKKKIDLKDESKGIWEKKIETLDSQSKALMKELRKEFRKKREAINEEKEKFDLLGARYSYNSSNGGVTILIKEQESIKNSLSNTSEMITVGRNILTSLKFQGDSLKRIQKKVYTLLNEVGLSNTMTKLIERRSRNDMYILCFCFVILIIVIIILYFYVRPMIKGD